MLEDDLDAIVVDGLTSIRVPKSESAEDMRKVDALLATLERKRGLAAGTIRICPSLESAKGVWLAYEIASSSPRIHSVMCGTAENGDLQTDLGYTWTAEGHEKLYIRSRVLLAARAAGVEHVLDGAFSNVRDPEGLRIDCEAARKLGYRGRSVIHPNQIETVNRVFKPTEEELDYYRRVMSRLRCRSRARLGRDHRRRKARGLRDGGDGETRDRLGRGDRGSDDFVVGWARNQ